MFFVFLVPKFSEMFWGFLLFFGRWFRRFTIVRFLLLAATLAFVAIPYPYFSI